eukprot:357140_1
MSVTFEFNHTSWLLMVSCGMLFIFVNGDTITCIGRDVCRGDTIQCAEDEACVLQCDGASSCREAAFTCSPGYPCTVTCTQAASCRAITIKGQESTMLNVSGLSDNTNYLQYSIIRCPTNGGECYVSCIGSEQGICAFMAIHAQEAGSLLFVVEGARTNAIASSEVYCPTNPKSCDIRLYSNNDNYINLMGGLEIYTQSIYDLSLICNASLANCWSDGNE